MMSWSIIGEICARLLANRARFVLSSAGVAIGSATLVVLVNLTESVRRTAEDKLEAMGARSLLISSKQAPSGRQAYSLSAADARAIEFGAPSIERVSVLVRFQTLVSYAGRSAIYTVSTVVPEELRVAQHQLAWGRFVTDLDEKRANPICVVGGKVADGLGSPRSGRARLSVGIGSCRIVGILENRSVIDDETVFLPASYVARLNTDRFNGALVAELRRGASDEPAKALIESVLRRRHGIRDEAEDDFSITRRQDLSDSMEAVARRANSVLAGVVFWSLIIATTGIANAVLTSVMERTTEIGVKRAVGATKGHIRAEFLCEGALTGLAGALSGVVVGSVFFAALSVVLKLVPVFSWRAAAFAAGVSFALGAAAAIWPAHRAANLQPAAAIYHV